MGSDRCAYEHAVSEIYIPGSSGDDQETFPTFHVANGDVSEAHFLTDDCPSGAQDNPEDLSTRIEKALVGSDRPTTFLSNGGVYPGGDDGLESGDAEKRTTTVSADRGYWSIQGDYFVRAHKE